MSFVLYFNFKSRITEHALPPDENIQYKIDISDETGIDGCTLLLEACDGVWNIVSGQSTTLSSGSTYEKIEDGKTINLSVRKTTVTFVVLASAISENTGTFFRYKISERIRIGSSSDSDIIIKNELVSRNHAYISQRDDVFFITDTGRNGIYINGIKAEKEEKLRMFDIIYIFGTKIVFLGDIIAVNNPEDTEIKLKKFISGFAEKLPEKKIKNDIYREQLSFDLLPVKICLPKLSASGKYYSVDITDILKTALPTSSFISSALFISDKFSIPVFAGVFIVMSSLISSIVYFIKKFQNNYLQNKELKIFNQEKDKYIIQKEQEIIEKQKKLINSLDERYMTARKLISMIPGNIKGSIRRDNIDFLKIRIGNGIFDFRKYIICDTEKDFEYFSVEKYSSLSGVPEILDLRSEKILNITGSSEQVYGTIRDIIISVAVLSDTADVRMMTFSYGSAAEHFKWMRWLPFVYSEDRKIRYTAFSEKYFRDIIFILAQILSERAEKRKKGYEGHFYPHYIITISSNDIVYQSAVSGYMKSTDELGVTFIIANINNDENISISGCCSNSVLIKAYDMDYISEVSADRTARLIASLYDDEDIKIFVPDSLSFFDMCNINRVKDIDVLRNYQLNRASDGIRLCIGMSDSGKKFVLDIHEKMHGPHGLVAGTTGSGKSELLQTMVLSAVLSYHPGEVSFVLIDYKGGGMAGIFEKLPHTSGMVTNLSDGINLAGRALVSLRSEIRKRQLLFKEYGVSSTDEYMRLYRAGKANFPVPHLIIIVDEFAELKRENPEFISQLISISRVGRSLGFHLILATQKPSGVIDEEISGNSRFRLCLKVQDKSDSMEMLGRPEAANISVTGRAYVQIGNDEIFEMIQTAYSGAVYNPDAVPDDLYMTGDDGQRLILHSVKMENSNETQVIAAVSHILDICGQSNTERVCKLWEAPLSEIIYAHSVPVYTQNKNFEGIVFSAGVVDDPENQSVYPAIFDFSKDGNIIVAGCSGCGKTVFVETMLCTLSENYKSEKFKFIVLDFAGGLFEIYENFPQCTGVYQLSSENKTGRVFENLIAEKEKRRLEFVKSEVQDYVTFLSLGNIMPALVVVIDGFGIFREMYPSLEDEFMRIASESAKYGIYFVVTIKQLSDMRIRTRQCFRRAVVFALNDFSEYSEFFGKRPSMHLPDISGRGFLKTDRILEFQTAVFCNATGKERTKYMKNFIDKIKEEAIVQKAESIGETAYCTELENITDEEYANIIRKFSEKNKVYIWSYNKLNLGESFLDSEGLYNLMLLLKKEFAARHQMKKDTGKFSGDNIYVFFSLFDDFCKCIYEKPFRSEIANAAEMFLEKGSGLGIYFIARTLENSEFSDKVAYKLFKSYKTIEEKNA